MAGATMLMSGGLISCSAENTTGVETENSYTEEGAGDMNNASGGSGEYGEGSTEDYDRLGAGGAGGNTADEDNDAPIGMDTARTTTPAVDNGN